MARFISKRAPQGACIVLFLFAWCVLAQTTYTLLGLVTGEDGKPLPGAVVKIDRKDVKWSATLKTNKRGEYTHAGLPVGGVFKITVEVDGKEADSRDNYKPRLGEQNTVNFDLAEIKKTRDAQMLAAQTGTLTAEQAKNLTSEQRDQIQANLKAREKEIAQNKALNDSFNAGVAASEAGQLQAAVDAFSKAAELDPKQDAVFGRLAEAYLTLGGQKTGAEQEAAYAKAVENYQKAIDIRPTESGYVNNYGTALVKMKKIPEAQAAFEKAASMDPPNAYKYYYNLGAVLMNQNQMDAAGLAFKKAIDTNPKYAIAQYQYGLTLLGKAQIGADGKITPPPGTREAFLAYLDLEPNGPNAQSAKDMLAQFDQAIETNYTSPEAKQKAEEAAKKKQQQQKKK
jgi:tetratricopeptide (TPR) repeat protein